MQQLVHVVVKPGSKKGPYIQLGLDGSLLVCVREPALEGKANQAVIQQLSEYFKVPKSRIKIKTGAATKHKTFIIT
jgi:uncharacterized protein